MKLIEQLLLENKAWSQECIEQDPNFFLRLAKEQTPEILWIGCSDSRVPAEQITASDPGTIFVHRNIANLVVSTDLNLLSVLQYAVDVLKVKDVIVCGHYGCGGIRAAMNEQQGQLLLTNNWLLHIKNMYRVHREELDRIFDTEKRLSRLVELNVMEQVHNLAHTSIIQMAWKRERRPVLHGWVYGLHNGIIDELFTMDWNSPLDPLFQYDLE
jgi:carbonic anhydrase